MTYPECGKVLSLIHISFLLITGIAHCEVNDSFYGSPVEYIRLECAYPIPKLDVLNAIDICEGDILTPSKIRKSLENLNLLKRFRYVEVNAAPFNDGVMLIYFIEPEWLVNKIVFKGKNTGFLFAYGLASRISIKEIERVTTIKQGSVFSQKSIDQTISALKKLYLNYGYGQCKISYSTSPNEEAREINLTFKLTKNDPTFIRNVSIEGNMKVADQDLVKAIKSKPGRRFLKSKFETDVQRLRSYLRNRGFLKARVRSPEFIYDSTSNTIDIKFSIIENEPVSIKLTAPKHLWNFDWWLYHVELKPHTLYNILDLDTKDEIDEKALDDAQQAILSEYQKHGYSQSEITLQKTIDENGVNVYSYDVYENKQLKIDSISMEGNSIFPTSELSQLLISQKNDYFQISLWEQDQLIIQNFYQKHGYLNVKVNHSETPSQRKTNKIDLTLSIIEGEKTVIEAINLSGIQHLTEGEIREVLPLKPQDPFYEPSVQAAITILRSRYEHSGYTQIEIKPSIIEGTTQNSKIISIQVEEGKASSIDKVLFTGYKRTKRSLIEKNISGLEGKPFNYSNLMDTQRRLTRTGLFSSARWHILPQEDGLQKKTVIFSLTERGSLFLETGPGYNTDIGLSGYINFYTTSLFGTNRYLGSSIFISQLSEKSQVIYREPEFAGYPVQFEIRLFRNLTDENDYRLFRYGGRANWTYRFTKSTRTILEYRLDEDRAIDIKEGFNLPEEIRNSVKIGSLAPSLILDTRDDPRDPTKGYLISGQIEFARPAYNSDVDFTKTIVEAIHFININKDDVLGLSAQFGWGRDLPIQEKFKLGGIKTIRGWGFEDIRGPKIEGIRPEGTNEFGYGGNTFILGNIEYRKPLFWGLMGVVFIDSGNVWTDFNEIDLNHLKTTLGLGLRFMTPIGPVGLDYGFNITRENYDPRNHWSFVIGHTF